MNEPGMQPGPLPGTDAATDAASVDRETGEDTRSWTARHPALTYTLARFSIFLGLVAIGLVFIDSPFVLLVTAAILSSIKITDRVSSSS